MNKTLRKKIEDYVEEHIVAFHVRRAENLQKLKLKDVLKNKNPYLFRAKDLQSATSLVNALMDARLSSSEEGSFGSFLENLAIYVAELTGGGQKSAAKGLDIELTRDKIRYLIAVKSGKNWGNSSSHRELKKNFATAVKVIRQSHHAGQLQPTLGICYGNFKKVNNGIFLKIGGQQFWHLLSGDPNLYIDLVEPLGKEAELHNKNFALEKDKTYNRLVRELTSEYCDQSGAINWAKLVRFVSGNMPDPA
jgi:hypothetical protein